VARTVVKILAGGATIVAGSVLALPSLEQAPSDPHLNSLLLDGHACAAA